MFPPNLFAMNKACQIGKKKKSVTKKVHYADSTSTTRLMTPEVNAFSYARSRVIPEKPVPHAFDEIKHLMVNSTKNLFLPFRNVSLFSIYCWGIMCLGIQPLTQFIIFSFLSPFPWHRCTPPPLTIY